MEALRRYRHMTLYTFFPTCSQTLDDTDSRAAPLRQLKEGGAEQQELSQKKTATGAQWWPFLERTGSRHELAKGKRALPRLLFSHVFC